MTAAVPVKRKTSLNAGSGEKADIVARYATKTLITRYRRDVRMRLRPKFGIPAQTLSEPCGPATYRFFTSGSFNSLKF